MKPLAEFHKSKAAKDGRRHNCKPCDHARHGKWVRKNRTKLNKSKRRWYSKNRALVAEWARRDYRKHRARRLIGLARVRARDGGMPFDLREHEASLAARVNAGKCELTGIPFASSPARAWNTPSLDRIVPKKGYIYSNVRVVCRAINCALGDWGPEILLMVVRSYQDKAA